MESFANNHIQDNAKGWVKDASANTAVVSGSGIFLVT